MSTGVTIAPPAKLVSTSPARPRTVTVSGLLSLWPSARPCAVALFGSECGAVACAANTTSTLSAPALTTTGAALTPSGRPLTSTVTASLNAPRRVTVARTLAAPPCRSTTLSVASVSLKLPCGGGGGGGGGVVSSPGGGALVGASGVASSPEPPPQAARVIARVAMTVIVRSLDFT